MLLLAASERLMPSDINNKNNFNEKNNHNDNNNNINVNNNNNFNNKHNFNDNNKRYRDRSNSKERFNNEKKIESEEPHFKKQFNNNTNQKNKCIHFSKGNCSYGDKCKFSHQMWLHTYSHKLDSGADASVVNSINLIQDYTKYDKDIVWYTVNNQPLFIKGEGYINIIHNKDRTKVYYSPDVDSNVLSIKDLQQQNLQIIFPPLDDGDGLGAWIIDKNQDKILYRTKENYVIDIHDYNEDLFTNIDINTHIKTVKSKISLDNENIKSKVADIQRRFGYPTKKVLLNLQQNIDNFPINKNQIKKYYVQFPWFNMGCMTKSSFITINNSKYPLNNIGDVVATDSIPIKSYGSKYDNVNLFIDSLSGHCTVISGKKMMDLKNSLNTLIEW